MRSVTGEEGNRAERVALVLTNQVTIRALPVQVFSGIEGGLDRLDKLAGGLG